MANESLFARLARREIWASVLNDRSRGSIKRAAGAIIERAHSADPAGTGSLNDIEHVVMLMQENRSFDHYYGTLSGVRGFDDVSPAFSQKGYEPGKGVAPEGVLNPFRLKTTHGLTLDGEAITIPSMTGGRSTVPGTTG
jgi:phospholipase C